MKTIKVSEATSIQLDWLVAKLEGYEGLKGMATFPDDFDNPSPTTKWAQGGPIIEAEGISLLYLYVTEDPFRWAATEKPTIRNVKPKSVYGPTALIAAMRCYVASKLGDEVGIPEELA